MLCFLILLLINVSLTLGIYKFIEKWRNEPHGGFTFYYGSQAGLNDYVNSGEEVSANVMVDCIEELRDGDSKIKTNGIIEFDKALEFFGKCFCIHALRGNRTSCKPTINYDSEDLRYRHFQKFKIKQALGALKYFEQANLPEKKENVFFKTINNRGSQPVKSTVVTTFYKTKSVTISSSREIGGSVGGNLELNLGFVSVKANLELCFSHSGSRSDTEEGTDTFSLERQFEIPSNSAVQIICSLKKQDFDLAWEIPVNVTGFVAVKYKNFANEKDEIIFLNVKYAARYFKDFSLSRDDPPILQGFIRGRTTGSIHYDAEVNPQTMELGLTSVQQDICNPLPSTG